MTFDGECLIGFEIHETRRRIADWHRWLQKPVRQKSLFREFLLMERDREVALARASLFGLLEKQRALVRIAQTEGLDIRAILVNV